jgi:hypothetical protein
VGLTAVENMPTSRDKSARNVDLPARTDDTEVSKKSAAHATTLRRARATAGVARFQG